jgi:hypothetical protein
MFASETNFNGYPFLFPTTVRILAKAAANIQLYLAMGDAGYEMAGC